MIRLFVCLSGDFLQNRMWRLSELCKEVKKPSNLKSDFFFFFEKKILFEGFWGQELQENHEKAPTPMKNLRVEFF